jgi:hypothetical protein
MTRAAFADRLDRATPLQRAILQILRDGGSLTAVQVFDRLELHTPGAVTSAHLDAVSFAVGRALERLAADGLLTREPGLIAPAYRLTREATTASTYRPAVAMCL